jgi:predicted Zn-dependent peptidase
MSNKSDIVLEKNVYTQSKIQPHIIKINNLRCVLVNYPCSNVISTGFFVKIGSAYESIEERGISHFLEHMLFKKNKYCSKMTNKLDELGISYNAATSRDYTYYECHGNVSQTKHLIFLLFMIFTRPIFIDKDVNKERLVIFEEMKGDKMSNKKQLFESTINQIYNQRNENYSLPIIGNTDTLNNINAKKLKNFFDTYYHYDNATFVVVGNIDVEVITSYLKKLVNKYPRSGTKTEDIIFNDISSPPTMIIKSMINPSQTTMMINFFIKGLSELQKLQLSLLHHILTGNFMSILFNELRVKRGLCYGIDSDNMLVKSNNKYNGIFFIKVDADPENIKECLKLILQFILSKKINRTTFLNSKKSLHNIISFSFQTSKDYMYFYGNMILNNENVIPSNIIKILKETTLKDINNLLTTIKNSNLYVNMIGKYVK